jgi:dicarboxylate transporter 10
MQTFASIPGHRKPTTINVLRSSVQISGISSIYVGITASIMRQMSYSLVRLGVYESLKQRLTEGGQRKPEAWRLIVAAGVAGGLGGIAGNPAGQYVSLHLEPELTAAQIFSSSG